MNNSQSKLTKRINTASKLIEQRGVSFALTTALIKFLRFVTHLRLKQRAQASNLTIKLGDKDFHLHPSVMGLSATTLMFGVHEPENTKLYTAMLKKGYTVLDIGGNIGYFPLIARDAVGESGFVYTLEPVPDTFEVLCQNVAKYKNIKPLAIAIGKENGESTLHISHVPNWSGLISYSGQDTLKSIPITTRSVDSLVEEMAIAPKVIRMDIEGGEINAIAGAVTTLAKYKPNLCIELHPTIVGKKSIAELIKLLSTFGYDRVVCIDRMTDEPFVPESIRKSHIHNVSLRELLNEKQYYLAHSLHMIAVHPSNE